MDAARLTSLMLIALRDAERVLDVGAVSARV